MREFFITSACVLAEDTNLHILGSKTITSKITLEIASNGNFNDFLKPDGSLDKEKLVDAIMMDFDLKQIIRIL